MDLTNDLAQIGQMSTEELDRLEAECRRLISESHSRHVGNIATPNEARSALAEEAVQRPLGRALREIAQRRGDLSA